MYSKSVAILQTEIFTTNISIVDTFYENSNTDTVLYRYLNS